MLGSKRLLSVRKIGVTVSPGDGLWLPPQARDHLPGVPGASGASALSHLLPDMVRFYVSEHVTIIRLL